MKRGDYHVSRKVNIARYEQHRGAEPPKGCRSFRPCYPERLSLENQKKGNRTAVEFGFPHLMEQAKIPLKDAAAVNTTRWALWWRLNSTGLPLEMGTGGRTKWNRTRLGWDKTHANDAACVGASTPDDLALATESVLLMRAKGHGSRQMGRTNKYGFPIRHVPRQKVWFGFRTGDLVRAVAHRGKYAGVHVGRVAIRTSGKFNIATAKGLVQGISYRHCHIVQRADGYAYGHRKEERHSSHPVLALP